MQKNTKHFVFISTLYGSWGGSEELWSKTALHCLQNKHKVSVIGFKQEETPTHIQRLIEAGANYHTLPNESLIGRSSLLQKIVYRFVLKNNNHLGKLINQIRPTKIIVNQGGNLNAVLDSQIRNFLLNTSHNYILTVRLARRFGTEANELIDATKRIFAKAQHIVFAAKNNLIATEQQVQIKHENGIVLQSPLKLKTKKYVPYPNSDVKNFACVARLDVDFKGQDILIRTLSTKKWKSRSWQLNFYGKGHDLEFLESLARFNKIEHKVKFWGHVENLTEVWSQNHIHILPSIEEGSPIALMESMVCGRTAVVTNVGGNVELIHDNKTGFVAKAPTIELLDNALEEAWQNNAQWENMGKSAHQWAKVNLDPNPDQTFYQLLVE